MQANNDGIWGNYRLYDSTNQVDTGDVELAYQLQNSAPGDPEVLKQILSRYADRLYKWVAILMFYCNSALPLKEQVLSALQDVLITSLEHKDQFHGQESVFDWLLNNCYRVVWKNKRGELIKGNADSGIDSMSGDIAISQSTRAVWESVDQLPEKYRSAVILRYEFDLRLEDIALILNLQVKEVHRRLSAGRKRLTLNPIKSHLDSEISAYMDGLLDENLDELNQVLDILADCSVCQSAARQVNDLEKSLSNSLKIRWTSPTFSQDELDEVIHAVLEKINQHDSSWNVNLPIRQFAWILGLTLAFIGLAVMFIRSTPAEREFPQAVSTQSPELPPVINMQPEMPVSQGSNYLVAAPQFIAPAFSSDGKWAAFASIYADQHSGNQLLPTIEVYNRESGSVQVISTGGAQNLRAWIWWNLLPSISGDGRWIVYVSTSHDPEIPGVPCVTPYNNSCLDIFLYDRQSGSTKRITQAAEGGPANGDSLAPTISADGQWVAFWSAATNLVGRNTNSCSSSGTNVACLYLYLYNLESGEFEFLPPVRSIPGYTVYGVDPISLSADGRYLGFSITPEALAGISLPTNSGSQPTDTSGGNASKSSFLNIIHSSEAVVYDRQTGRFELENQAQDGTPGDADSSRPVLSADGRYVAFVSSSTNLVANNFNYYSLSNVYVRDRQSGEIQLISKGLSVWFANGDSGLTFGHRGYYSLNISADGRYVVFGSNATNLAGSIDLGCNQASSNNECEILYVNDRQTGKTELIATQKNQDFSLFPQISSDGRWVSFMQTFHTCNAPQYLCSDVMLYDRQQNWLANLMKYEEQSPSLPWSLAGNITLPWQTWESTAVAYSPDGQQIALGGSDSKVRIWQISDISNSSKGISPSIILESAHNDQFSTLAFRPDGQWLAAGSADGSVYIWSLPDGRLLYSLDQQSGLVRKLAFTQDGTHLIISTLNETWIWRIAEGQINQVNQFDYGPMVVYALDINISRNLLATARGDGLVWIQSLPSGDVIGRLRSSEVASNSLAFSPDGTLLAERSMNGKIDLWKIDTSDTAALSVTLVSTFQSNEYVGDLIFSPDNQYLASTGVIGEVTLWSLPEGKLRTVSSSVPNDMVFSLAFSKLGSQMAVVFENEIVVWAIPGAASTSYYFSPAAASYITSLPFPDASANDFLQPQLLFSITAEGNLTLDQAAARISFPLYVPTHLPDNITFGEASVFKDGSAWLQYYIYEQEAYQASIFILEKPLASSFAPTMTVGANAEVIHTTVNTAYGHVLGEYVAGDWMLTQNISPPNDNSNNAEVHDVWEWDNSLYSQRLRWQQNGVLLALYYQVYQPYKPVLNTSGPDQQTYNLSNLLTRLDLEQIASGMVPLLTVQSGVFCDFIATPGSAGASKEMGDNYVGQVCRGSG